MKGYYRLIIRGGRSYEGHSKAEIIEKMRVDWFGENISKIQYKDEVSRRIGMLYGKVISRSHFINDLEREGLAKLEIINSN